MVWDGRPPLTVDQLAARWACSPAHVRNLIHRRELFAFRAGRLIRIAASEVERFECGSSTTEGAGTLSGPRTDRPAASPSAPKIVALPNSVSRIW